MQTNEYLSIIEGMIFLSGDEGMTLKQIMAVLEISKKEAREYLKQLLDYYDQKPIKGFQIVNYGGCYKMVTLVKHEAYYAKMIIIEISA